MRIKESSNSKPLDPMASKSDDELIRDALPPQIEQPLQPDNKRRVNVPNLLNLEPRTYFQVTTGLALTGAFLIEQARPGTFENTVEMMTTKPIELIEGVTKTATYAFRDTIIETKDGLSDAAVDLGQYVIRGPVRSLTQQSAWACITNECRITLPTNEPPPPPALVAAETVVGAVALALVVRAVAAPALRLGEAITMAKLKK